MWKVQFSFKLFADCDSVYQQNTGYTDGSHNALSLKADRNYDTGFVGVGSYAVTVRLLRLRQMSHAFTVAFFCSGLAGVKFGVTRVKLNRNKMIDTTKIA